MLKISEETVKEIADFLDAGMDCYYNPKNGELIDIPPDLDWDIDEDEDDLWADVKEKINNAESDLIKFEKMDSRQSFRVMQEFAENVEDPKVQDRLVYALNGQGPFRRFKDEINYYVDYRQPWFDFKDRKYIEYVKDLISFENNKLMDCEVE